MIILLVLVLVYFTNTGTDADYNTISAIGPARTVPVQILVVLVSTGICSYTGTETFTGTVTGTGPVTVAGTGAGSVTGAGSFTSTGSGFCICSDADNDTGIGACIGSCTGITSSG